MASVSGVKTVEPSARSFTGSSFPEAAVLEFFAQCRDDHGVPRLQFALLAVSKVGALEEVGVEEQEQGLEQRRVVRVRGPGQRRSTSNRLKQRISR